MDFFLMLLCVILTAILSISGGALFLFSKNKFVNKIKKFGPVIAFAVLLYAVFGDIIPEILEEEELEVPVLITLVLTGLFSAAIIGHFLGHFHHHSDACHHNEKEKARAYTMLAVDSVHAVADGFVLGTSFVAAPSTGISTCLATVAHEIPQEIGDFEIFRHAKIPKKKILKMQLLSSFVIIPSATIAYFVGSSLLEALPGILAVIAGFLLYVALGELLSIIELFKKKS